jgi:hypothetical protein
VRDKAKSFSTCSFFYVISKATRRSARAASTAAAPVPEERGKMNRQITQTIREEILKWPGITTEPNRFGGIE